MQTLLNSAAIAGLSALLAFFAAAFWWGVKHRKEQEARVTELEKQLAVIRAEVTPISAAMLAVWIKELTHPHTKELDKLLAGLQPYTLTPAKLKRLKVLLLERTTDDHALITDSERLAAQMVPILLEKLQVEADLPAEATDLVMVSIPKDVAK